MKQVPISQTKKTPKKGILTSKGFYILLTLLIVAVAITGYVTNQKAQVNSKLSQADIKTSSSKIKFEDPPIESYASPPAPIATPAAKIDDDTPPPMAATDEAEPVDFVMPLGGELSLPYSGDDLVYSKTMEDWRTHTGIDFPGSIGSHVKAAANGVVEDIYLDEMLGNVITIRHSDKLVTRYCNLQDEPLVKKGQRVEVGNIIGGIGHSAPSEIADPPHLHFELLEDGVPINPADYM